MTTSLSFRKESIQCSSRSGEALSRVQADPSGKGSRFPREPRQPAITTILTTLSVATL